MDKAKNKEIGVRIICVVAAFILWIYITDIQNPSRKQSVTLNVQLTNTDSLAKENFALLPPDKYTVTITLQGPSSDIISAKASQFSAVADLSGYALHKGENKIPVQVEPLIQNSSVNIVEPFAYVKVYLDDLLEKNIPVRTSDIKLRTKSGYMAFDPVMKPSTVSISGAAQFVNSVSYVKPKYTEEKDVDKNLEQNLSLEAFDNADRVVSDVKINPENVDMIVPVKKIKTVSVNIKTKGALNNTLSLKNTTLVSDKIDIAGDDKVLSSINSLDTEPIDLGAINTSKSVDVKLIVPDNITLVNSKGTVSVKYDVENIISKNYSVDIKFNNLATDRNMTADKTKITLIILGPESKVSGINPADDLKCTVDLSNLSEGEAHLVPVTVKIPDGLNIVSATPQNVNVTITKKADANTTSSTTTSTATNQQVAQ